MTPRIRAKRILSALEQYKSKDDPYLIDIIRDYNITLEYDVIGIYFNIPNSIKESIILTDNGITVIDEAGQRSVLYDSILGTIPMKNDGSDVKITAMLADGGTFVIPVRGRSERFQDIFEFLRYLNRSIMDVQKAKRR